MAAIALAAAIAGASTVSIGFDDLASGTTVTEQYASQGIHFGKQPTGSAGTSPIAVSSGLARSTPNVARMPACPGVPNCPNRIDAAFDQPATTITMYVGESSGATQNIKLDGLAANGASVASAQVGIVGPTPATHQLTVNAPAGQAFAGFKVTLPSGSQLDLGVVVDDLSFDKPDPPAPTETTPTTTVPQPGPLPAGAIAGPAVLRLTQPGRYVGHVDGDAVSYEWDLDGNGSFEQATGNVPAVQTSFPQPGSFHIAMRAGLADGRAVTASRDVTVVRPRVSGLGFSPSNPKPGQAVAFDLGNASEPGTKAKVFAWKFGGVKPLKTTIKLPSPKAKKASAAAVPTAPGPNTLALTGAQPTLAPKLTRSFPKARAVEVDVNSSDNLGEVTRVHTFVRVGGGGRPGPKPKYAADVIDCDNDAEYEGSCAAIGITGTPATKVQTVITDATPGAKVCVPSNATVDGGARQGKFEAAKNLPYPAPESFALEGAQGGQVGIGARAARVDRQCVSASPVTKSWDLGDGTKINATNGAAPSIVKHVYKKAGAYKVTLVVQVPYFEFNPKGKKPVEFFTEKHFLARVHMTLEVVEAKCEVLKLNSIPVSTVVKNGAPGEQGAQGCFLPRKTLDGKGTVYTPFPGYDVDLNTLRVVIGFGDFSSAILVDPAAAQISAAEPGSTLEVTAKPLGLNIVREGEQVVAIGKPVLDPELNAKVTPLGGYTYGGGSYAGLTLAGSEVLLSPDHGAFARVYLRMPPPLGKQTPLLVLGGGPGVTGASNPADDANTDFEVDLSGVDIGLLQLEQPTFLKHRKAGGWLASAVVKIPPVGLSLIAPYKRPPSQSTVECLGPNGPDGPSGLSLEKNGSFEFGGAALTADPGPTLGPIEFHCLSVAVSVKPFFLVGKAGVFIPPSSPIIDFDACFLIAVLNKGDPAVSGCNATVKPPEDMTWFRAGGSIGIHNFVKLGEGYFDLRKGTNLLEVRTGGGIKTTYFGFAVEVGVDGTLILQPKFAFDIYGHGKICTPEVLGVGVCGKGELVVSTKGLGACLAIAGFEYFWGGGLSVFGGCDLSNSELRVSSLYPAFGRPSGVPVFGAATSVPVKVPPGLRKVGFHLRGVDGVPDPIVNGPGLKITSDGAVSQKGRGWRITRMGPGDTFVVVEKPRGGTWTFDAKPGTTALKDVGLEKPLKEPRVLAKIQGRGAKRTLVWNAELDPGDSVRFMEDGMADFRQLGSGRNGKGRAAFAIGTSSPGLRTITAVVERRGMPYKRFKVASYKAPKPPAVRPATRIAAKHVRGNRLAVSWRRPAAVKSFTVSLALADGRVLKYTTKAPKLTLRDMPVTSAGRISIISLSTDGRHSKIATAAIKAGKLKRKPLRI